MDTLGRTVYKRESRPTLSGGCGRRQHVFRGDEVCLASIADNHMFEVMYKVSGYRAWTFRAQVMGLLAHIGGSQN